MPRRRGHDVRDRHPTTGLGRTCWTEGRLHEAAYRFDRIDELVVPNTRRLLDWAREHDMRRVFLTYGSEVSDYSDLSPQLYDLCRATSNRVGLREHEILDELAPRPDERVINKITPSAFTSSPIELILRTYGVEDLVFTGRLHEHVRGGHDARRGRPRLRLRARRRRLRGRLAGLPRHGVVALQRLYGDVCPRTTCSRASRPARRGAAS